MFVDGRFLQVHLCLPWLLLLWSEQQGFPVAVRDGWEGTARSPGLIGPREVLLARGPHLPPQGRNKAPSPLGLRSPAWHQTFCSCVFCLRNALQIKEIYFVRVISINSV